MPEAPAQRAPPGTRRDYRLFLPATTRWADNDRFGHLNNAVYLQLIDTALWHRLAAAGVGQDPGAEHFLLVAESGCRFHAELGFPDPVTLGLRLGRLGTSSLRGEVALFRGDADVASAEGFMIHVCVEARSRRPAPLPERWRAALRQQEETGRWTPD